MSRWIWMSLLVVGLRTVNGVAETYELNFDSAPSSQYLDRWVYPFNVSPGARIQASTFGAVGSEGFDERDGQYLIAINTRALGIPTDQPPARYQIESARLIVSETTGGYTFDPTYDSFATYLTSGSAGAQRDADPGRPIELYGAGLRNDYEHFGWPDGAINTQPPVFSAGSPFGASDRGTRNVFAIDAIGNDVSNNVDSLNGGANGFDPTPLSIGQAFQANGAPVSPGSAVPATATIAFDIDVANADIQRYLQTGLAAGQLGFVVTSLHDAGLLGGDNPFVNLATANHFAVAGPRFEITVNLVDAGVPGDFDASGALDVADVDLLIGAINTGSSAAQFDVNTDSAVDTADLQVWIRDLFGTYLGDANLDGEFNSSDLVAVFGAGEYEDAIPGNSRWSTGDWNADGDFSTSDLVTAFSDGGYEQGPRGAVAVVPEPAAAVLAVFGGLILVACSRHTSQPRRLDAKAVRNGRRHE